MICIILGNLPKNLGDVAILIGKRMKADTECFSFIGKTQDDDKKYAIEIQKLFRIDWRNFSNACEFQYNYRDKDGTLKYMPGVLRFRLVSTMGKYQTADMLRRPGWGKICNRCTYDLERPIYHVKEKSNCKYNKSKTGSDTHNYRTPSYHDNIIPIDEKEFNFRLYRSTYDEYVDGKRRLVAIDVNTGDRAWQRNVQQELTTDDTEQELAIDKLDSGVSGDDEIELDSEIDSDNEPDSEAAEAGDNEDVMDTPGDPKITKVRCVRQQTQYTVKYQTEETIPKHFYKQYKKDGYKGTVVDSWTNPLSGEMVSVKWEDATFTCIHIKRVYIKEFMGVPQTVKPCKQKPLDTDLGELMYVTWTKYKSKTIENTLHFSDKWPDVYKAYIDKNKSYVLALNI